MATKTKTEPTLQPHSTPAKVGSPVATPALNFLSDPKMRMVKSHTDLAEYKRALELLSKLGSSPEVLNCRGVCLLRMHEFVQAISPLRMAALNSTTFHLHENVAQHIKINFAIALFFGGEPGGGIEILAQSQSSADDPMVKMLRAQTRQWVASMNIFRRIDWYLNRISPKKGPVPPTEPVGRFVWELDTFAAESPRAA